MKELKKLRCIHLADKRDNEKLCNAIEEVKFLNAVIDLMATDNSLLCTDYEFGCFYEKNAECMKGPVRNCKECIKQYYFKKARGEENETN